MLYYTGTFLEGAHWFGVPFPKLQTFSGIVLGLPIDYSLYEKMILGIFCLFVYLGNYKDKSIFSFFTNSAVKPQHVLFANEPFLRKMLEYFFSYNIPLYIEKNLGEKLCKFVEMKFKTYTPVAIKFVFEKIKFSVLNYIQNSFIFQRPGNSKVYASIFKSLSNYFILKI